MVTLGTLAGTSKLVVFTKVVHGLISSLRFEIHSLKNWQFFTNFLQKSKKFWRNLPNHRWGKIQFQTHIAWKFVSRRVLNKILVYTIILAHDKSFRFCGKNFFLREIRNVSLSEKIWLQNHMFFQQNLRQKLMTFRLFSWNCFSKLKREIDVLSKRERLCLAGICFRITRCVK